MEKNLIDQWKEDAKTTNCLLHRFWAGRLAIVAEQVCHSNAMSVSANIKLLQQTLGEYNKVIFAEVNNN